MVERVYSKTQELQSGSSQERGCTFWGKDNLRDGVLPR
jgi:hypothetical protein